MFTYKYPRPALTVDALVFRKSDENWEILLIRRGAEPFIGKWALPGGFVDMEELLETACCRELEEETGLKINGMTQFKTFDAIDRDPRHRTISVVFYAILENEQSVKAGDDAREAAWFAFSDLPELAFDHATILSEFLSSYGWKELSAR